MSEEPRKRAASSPLQLFQPPDDATCQSFGVELSADMSLSEFFFKYVVPWVMTLRGDERKTIICARTAVHHWAALTGDPSLCRVDRGVGRAFVHQLAQLPGRRQEKLSASSVRSYVASIRAILRLATSDDPDYGAGLLPEVPQIPRPKKPAPSVEDVYTLDELGVLLGALRLSQTPSELLPTPGEWWTDVALAYYNTGLRAEEMVALSMKWLFRDKAGTFIRIDPAVHKMKRREIVSCNSYALQIFERRRQYVSSDDEPLFNWPRGTRWRWRCLEKLVRLTGLPSDRHFAFHAFRKAGSTELADINPLVVPAFLGHKSGSVTLNHYVNRRALAKAVEKLPQPRYAPTAGRDVQLWLFD